MKKADCITLKKLGILFFVTFLTSLSYSDEFKNEASRDLFMPGIILTVAANRIPDWESVAGPYIPGRNKHDSPADLPDITSGKSRVKGFFYEIGNAMDQMSCYFFRYFSVYDHSATDPEAQFRLKSKIRSFKLDPQDFQLDLSFDIGYHRSENLNIDAIRIESFFHHTFVSTVFHYEKNEFEIGLSNVMINRLLLDGMKLEIQTNPYGNSGAVLLTMAL